jgi:hypothetical protein
MTVVSEKPGATLVILDKEQAQRCNLRYNSFQSSAPDLWRRLFWSDRLG